MEGIERDTWRRIESATRTTERQVRTSQRRVSPPIRSSGPRGFYARITNEWLNHSPSRYGWREVELSEDTGEWANKDNGKECLEESEDNYAIEQFGRCRVALGNSGYDTYGSIVYLQPTGLSEPKYTFVAPIAYRWGTLTSSALTFSSATSQNFEFYGGTGGAYAGTTPYPVNNGGLDGPASPTADDGLRLYSTMYDVAGSTFATNLIRHCSCYSVRSALTIDVTADGTAAASEFSGGLTLRLRRDTWDSSAGDWTTGSWSDHSVVLSPMSIAWQEVTVGTDKIGGRHKHSFFHETLISVRPRERTVIGASYTVGTFTKLGNCSVTAIIHATELLNGA